MAFMYLHLEADEAGHIKATVKNNGATPTSLGGPNSQMTHAPFAVVRVWEFDGIGAIDDRTILDEVFRRFTTKDLANQLNIHMTDKELVNLLSDRLRRA